MYLLNGMMILDKEDLATLQMMTDFAFDKTSITPSGLNEVLNELEAQANDIPDDSGDGDFMMKTIINTGVAQLREKMAILNLQAA